MAQDKFGSMELGLINTDDLKVKSFKDLKSLWEQAEKLGWKGPEEGVNSRQIVFVPKNENGLRVVKEAADKHDILVIPVDYSNPWERNVANLLSPIPENISLQKELADSAKERIEIDTTDIPNPRYHDRTFPKHYDKKKRAKRRQQKHSRRRH